MAFWTIDLTTRVGAQGATHLGSMGAFGFAGLAVLGAVVMGGLTGLDTPEGMGIALTAGAEAVVGLIAGFRFRAGKGAFWGMAAAALLTIEMVYKVISLAIGGGLVINAVLLVCLVQGIRGAMALRSTSTLFEDDASEVFE